MHLLGQLLKSLLLLLLGPLLSDGLDSALQRYISPKVLQTDFSERSYLSLLFLLVLHFLLLGFDLVPQRPLLLTLFVR